ncbi:NADAR family protein [Halovulum sp. GXIMD14793]
MDVIKFYRTRDDYGCFSNFSAHPIELDGKIWPTSEHYFQAMKFEGHPDMEEIRLTGSPMKAAKMGRDRSRPMRADWDKVKDDVMRKVLKAKFEQNLDAKEILLGTGQAQIIEHTKNDSYWADGGDGGGANMLGVLLMELRSSMQSGS